MKKTFLISITVVVIIALGSFLYLKYRKLDDFEPQLKAKLQELVSKGSKGLYRLHLDKVNVDVVNSRVILSNIHIDYDSVVYARMVAAHTAPENTFEVKLRSLAIDGIAPDDVIRRKDIRLNILYVENPIVDVYHHNKAKEKAKKDSSNFYQLIRKELGSFGLKKLSLKNLDFTYHQKGDKVGSSFKDLFIDLDDIAINESTQYDTTRFLYAKDASISLKDFVYKTRDSIYNIRLDSISIKAAKNEVSIKRLRVEPRLSKQQYRKVMKLRKDRYDIAVNNVVLQDIDWWRFVTDEGFLVGHASISNGRVEIYSDKAIPADGKVKLGGYPHQKLFKMETPLYVKRISVKNLDITYSEFNIKTWKEGHLFFGNTKAVIGNVTNIAARVRENGHLKIDATSTFMNKGFMKAGFNFNLARQKEGLFSVYADLAGMDGTALNPATMPLASVEVNRANLKRFKVNISGDNYKANGRILLIYDDLKITVLKANDEGKLKKKGLLSFIANNFKINRQYPDKGKKPDAVAVSYKRPLQKSFFSMIWRTIFAGLKEPVGI